MGQKINLTNKRFGRLKVIRESKKRSKSGDVYWLCKCDCGTELIVNGRSLRHCNQKSCGCLQVEYAKKQHNNRTHNGSKERLFKVWRGMIDRCYYPSHNRFEHYGGRGITICEDWKNSYENFRDWAMNNGYNPNAKRGECTIDRIDNDKGYYPENCRFVDMKVQANNRRDRYV